MAILHGHTPWNGSSDSFTDLQQSVYSDSGVAELVLPASIWNRCQCSFYCQRNSASLPIRPRDLRGAEWINAVLQWCDCLLWDNFESVTGNLTPDCLLSVDSSLGPVARQSAARARRFRPVTWLCDCPCPLVAGRVQLSAPTRRHEPDGSDQSYCHWLSDCYCGRNGKCIAASEKGNWRGM